MDDIEKRVLSQMRSRLVKEVVVTESFLCAFCDNNILDDQMTRLLKTETNYESRASKLLDMLPSRGSRAFNTLMEILEITNPWLSEKMRSALHDERNKDAKINLHPSVSQSASIEGYGQNRLHIDTDVKERAMRFVKTNLNHLSDIEQRGVEKWLADELQRERRRQQFRAPHNIPRNPSDFHASKECQTDTSNMDLIELYEEMSIYLHGVDYVQINVDFSFKKLSHKITELLTRTRKLDALFLNCIEKFDDPDKYSIPLPELIDRAISKERSLSQVNNDDKRLIQKFSEERDMARRQVKRLEEELDKVLQRQLPTNKPQEIQLRNRQNINVRYSLLLPDSSQQQQQATTENSKTETSEAMSIPITQSYNTSAADNNNYQNGGLPSNYVKPVNIVQVAGDTKNNSIPNNSGNVPGRPYMNQSNSHENNYIKTNAVNTDSSYRNGMVQHYINTNYMVKEEPSEVSLEIPRGKLRRHASEESLKIALSKEDTETVSMSYLHNDQQTAALRGRRKSQDGPSNIYTPQQNNEAGQKQQLVKNTRNDIQNKMLRMLSGVSKSNIQKVRRSESEKAVSTHGVKVLNPGKNQDSGTVFKGNPSLRSSYDNLAAMSKRVESNIPEYETKIYSNVNTKNPYRFLSQNHSERVVHQQPPNGQQMSPSAQRGAHESRQERFQQLQYQMLQNRAGGLIYEEVVNEARSYPRQQVGSSNTLEHKTTLIYPRDYDISQHQYPTRAGSLERQSIHNSVYGPRPPSRKSSRDNSDIDYSSDSEVINSSIRKTTSSPDRAKGRVRFASPVSRSSKPNRKIHGKSKPTHYQSDTMSASMRKIKKT
ncbi:DNA N6-methyl adenine demethylase [Biomphalaria glabrata]|nr:DNA N6-methyl adenine demethylase; partial [Biomphalaria glabrata]